MPAPGESNWWNRPNVRICLTPAEALRHYVPWRTGEPNEMQGKSNWLLPLWLVFFPYNMFCALCWYAVCRILKVRGMPPPMHVMGSEYRERVLNTKEKKAPRRIEGLDRPEVGRAIGAGTLCAWPASAADQALNFLTQST